MNLSVESRNGVKVTNCGAHLVKLSFFFFLIENIHITGLKIEHFI